MSKERLQRTYSNMKTRCYNPNSNRYHCYGGRGIRVCDEWLGWGKGFKNFEKWALLNGYADNLTIDRIDVNGNYEPNNCRWVTNKQNTNNTRRNRNITYNGETHTMSEWCEILGVKLGTLSARIYRGWSLEDVMTKPIRKQTHNQIKAIKEME